MDVSLVPYPACIACEYSDSTYGLPTGTSNRSNWRHVKTHVRPWCFGVLGDYFNSQDCGSVILRRMTTDVCKRVGMFKSLNMRSFGQRSNQLWDSYHDSYISTLPGHIPIPQISFVILKKVLIFESISVC